jgi:putative FmdB family regulatory protein
LPLYPYRCTQCNHRFEKIQSFSAEPETICPECGGGLERPLTAPALQFKGAGWYVNDYAGKSAAPAAEKPAASCASATKCPNAGSCPAAPATA